MESPSTTAHIDVIRVLAPAKLNLRLKIVGRRTDGYHLLNMLNVTTSLCDEIEIEFRNAPYIGIDVQGEISRALRQELLDPRKNLAAKAAKLFLDEFGIQAGVYLQITKRIPAGSGLGGGSSDAAAVLRALLDHFMQKVGREKSIFKKIERLAVKLGADVPYLLRGGLALVQGVGELITNLPGSFLHGTAAVLILPGCHLPTAQIYSLFRDRHPHPISFEDTKLSRFVAYLNKDRCDPQSSRLTLYQELLALVENDLCEAACFYSNAVQEVLKRLRLLPGAKASMTGSGSAIFVLPNPPELLTNQFLSAIEERLRGLAVQIVPITLFANSCW